MSKSISLNHLVALAIPVSIIVLMVSITYFQGFVGQPAMFSFGVTFDLVLTAPIVYFLLVRKTAIPNITVVPFFILAVVVAGVVIPSEHQSWLELVKTWIVPLAELFVLTFVIVKVYGTRQAYHKLKGSDPDVFTALKGAAEEILPKGISTAFATEIAVFYYGLLDWKKRPLKQNEFSYHKHSGTLAVLGAIIFLVIAETFVFHLLLQRWSVTAAWIVSGLSIYSGLQLLGLARSMSKRPIYLQKDRLELRYGIFGEASISLGDIRKVEFITGGLPVGTKIIRLSPLGSLESPNVVLYLDSSHVLHRFYGIKRSFDAIALYVDKKEPFAEALL